MARVYGHAPPDYDCPFCRIACGSFGSGVASAPADVVHQDAHSLALIACDQWPGTPGHVLVIPSRHYENLYDLPLEEATRIHSVARRVALAMKRAYGCPGISTRQHNEPVGNQEVWHYHLHVFPPTRAIGCMERPRRACRKTSGCRTPRRCAERSPRFRSREPRLRCYRTSARS